MGPAEVLLRAVQVCSLDYIGFMILSCHDSVGPRYSSGSLDKGEMRPLPPAWVTL